MDTAVAMKNKYKEGTIVIFANINDILPFGTEVKINLGIIKSTDIRYNCENDSYCPTYNILILNEEFTEANDVDEKDILFKVSREDLDALEEKYRKAE